MTKQEAVAKLLDWARKQIGTEESGSNHNPYADIVGSKLYGYLAQDAPWCDIFVDAAFVSCFGYEDACKLTYQYSGCLGAACAYSAGYYKKNDAFTDNAEPGEQVFFLSAGAINHTGIVESCSGGIVTVIEGNSSDRVQRCSYSLSNPLIAGYGIPNWDVLEDEAAEDVEGAGNDVYTVASGDTLWYIAEKMLGSGRLYKELMKINKLTTTVIKPGQQIKLTETTTETEAGEAVSADAEPSVGETPASYTVKKNDTLWGIAERTLGSGPRFKEIKELNGLSNDMIWPGQVLKIPDK